VVLAVIVSAQPPSARWACETPAEGQSVSVRLAAARARPRDCVGGPGENPERGPAPAQQAPSASLDAGPLSLGYPPSNLRAKGYSFRAPGRQCSLLACSRVQPGQARFYICTVESPCVGERLHEMPTA